MKRPISSTLAIEPPRADARHIYAHDTDHDRTYLARLRALLFLPLDHIPPQLTRVLLHLG